MKRIISIAIALFLISGLSCKKEENTVPIKGIINFMSGNVKLIDTNGNAKNAKIGDEITQGMKIEAVGSGSFVDIFIGNYIIKVLGNSTVDVQKLFENFEKGNKEVRFSVQKGRLFSKITKKLSKDDSFEVTTPTATAAVRGTEFLVTEEEGKSNVACLAGLVEVLNNSLKEVDTVELQPKEETDVIPGENMVKKQISADKLRQLNILLQIRNMREDIRKKFEQQREEIRKHVQDQRAKNKEILDAQREKDKALVEDQKKRDRENIEAIKGTTDDAAKEAFDSAKQQMETVKVDKDAAVKEAEDKMESVKPVIDKDKFKVDKDQFKTQ
ncbi:MAG: FecR domain-containing protein [Spirochaetes bacterium]|nr:FecR domain-containing protein [Spirochaetota bacterium]